MTAVPPEAVTAAAVAIHDAGCSDTTCSGAALGDAYRLARVALDAAEPHIRAQVYDEIRQLMNDNHAHYDCDPHYGVPAADLIGDGDD